MDQQSELILKLTKKIEHLEFKQNLLFYNTDVDRVLFEYDITKEQYNKIMDLLDIYRTKIDKGEDISNSQLEDDMYKIVESQSGNYHFVEGLLMAFWEDRRWGEVFEKAYMNMPKYQHLKRKG